MYDQRPMSSELFIQLLEILGIPVVAAIILTFIKVATGDKPFEPELGVDIGMDLSILAAGACGGIFANDTLVKKWPHGLTVYGIFVVLVCILIVAVLSYVRRWRDIDTAGKAVVNVIVGALPLGMVASIL